MQTGTDNTNYVVRIAVSSSARNEVVGIGGAIRIATSARSSAKLITFSTTIGLRSQQNPFSGELAAMAHALRLLPQLRFRSIELQTRERSFHYNSRVNNLVKSISALSMTPSDGYQEKETR